MRVNTTNAYESTHKKCKSKDKLKYPWVFINIIKIVNITTHFKL